MFGDRKFQAACRPPRRGRSVRGSSFLRLRPLGRRLPPRLASRRLSLLSVSLCSVCAASHHIQENCHLTTVTEAGLLAPEPVLTAGINSPCQAHHPFRPSHTHAERVGKHVLSFFLGSHTVAIGDRDSDFLSRRALSPPARPIHWQGGYKAVISYYGLRRCKSSCINHMAALLKNERLE